MVTMNKKFTSIITLHKQRCSVDRFDYSIQSGNGSLFVRRVVPFRSVSRHYVIFVHGLTFPSVADFDLPLKGHSMAQFLAERGVNCCMFDMRGYGKSSNPAKVTLSDRIADIHTVYKHLKEKLHAETISLIGVSSGCNALIACMKKYDLPIRDIMLLGPCYLRNDFISRNIEKLQLLKLGRLFQGKWTNPYVSFGRKQLKKRIVKGEERSIHGGASAMFIEKAISQCNVKEGRLTSPILPFFDFCKKVDYMASLFPVDHITAPTLIIRGERDEICCKKSGVSLYHDLIVQGTQTEIYTHEGSKHDMHLYKNCETLFDRMLAFLSQKREG